MPATYNKGRDTARAMQRDLQDFDLTFSLHPVFFEPESLPSIRIRERQ